MTYEELIQRLLTLNARVFEVGVFYSWWIAKLILLRGHEKQWT